MNIKNKVLRHKQKVYAYWLRISNKIEDQLNTAINGMMGNVVKYNKLVEQRQELLRAAKTNYWGTFIPLKWNQIDINDTIACVEKQRVVVKALMEQSAMAGVQLDKAFDDLNLVC